MPTLRRTTAVAAVMALVLTACSADDPAGSAAPTSTSSSSSTSTTPPSSSSSTTPEEPTTSTTADPSSGAGGCQAFEPALPPQGATDVSEASADVDGDGEADRVLAYRQSDGDRKVAVELAGGGSAAVDASESSIDGPARLSVLGGVDLGGDGQTVLAVTGGGASVVIVGLFQFVECAIAQVRLQSGVPAELPVGGTVTNADGVACSEGTLVRRNATSDDGETFTTTDTSYRVDGNTLVELGAETATLSQPGDDTEIQRYYALACPTLERGL